MRECLFGSSWHIKSMNEKTNEKPMVINLEDAIICAKALRNFKSNSLTGVKIYSGVTYEGTLELDPLCYEHFGNSSPRHRFYVFEQFYKRNLVAYVVLTQKHPLVWLDRFGVWHLVGATRSNVAKRHQQYVEKIVTDVCFVYQIQQVIAANQTENEVIKEFTEISVLEYLMELAEDKRNQLDSLLF